MDKQRALVFIDELLTRLRSRKLLFEGWQMQREVRRKVKAEIHLLLLSKFKDYRKKIDDLTENIFRALEEVG